MERIQSRDLRRNMLSWAYLQKTSMMRRYNVTKLYSRRFGEIGDVYIPRNVNVDKPYNHSIAYVRFKEKEAADAALAALGYQLDRSG